MLNSKPALYRNVRYCHLRLFRHTFHRYGCATPNPSPARHPVSQDRSKRCPRPSLPYWRGSGSKRTTSRSKKSRSPPASPSRAVPYSGFFPALNDDLYPAAFLETLNNSPTLSSRDKYIIVKIAMGRRDRPQRTFKLPLDRHLVAVATSNSINLRQVTLFYGKPSPTPGLSCACRSPRSQPCPDVTDTNSVAVLHILLIEELHI
jgi:hypothetical protein